MIKKEVKLKVQENNKPLFDSSAQHKVVADNQDLLAYFNVVRTVEEWNDTRDRVKREFGGSVLGEMMLFGYIDGVLFPKLMIKALSPRLS